MVGVAGSSPVVPTNKNNALIVTHHKPLLTSLDGLLDNFECPNALPLRNIPNL